MLRRPAEAVGGSVEAHATAAAEVPHGRLTHGCPFLVQEVGQGRMSPIGALEAARPRPLAHPVQDEGARVPRESGAFCRAPTESSARPGPCPVARQEALDVAHRRPRSSASCCCGLPRAAISTAWHLSRNRRPSVVRKHAASSLPCSSISSNLLTLLQPTPHDEFIRTVNQEPKQAPSLRHLNVHSRTTESAPNNYIHLTSSPRFGLPTGLHCGRSSSFPTRLLHCESARASRVSLSRQVKRFESLRSMG